jgi:hypothetical protein
LDGVNCVPYYQLKYLPLGNVGNKYYRLSYSMVNYTAMEDVYDPDAQDLNIGIVGYYSILDVSDYDLDGDGISNNIDDDMDGDGVDNWDDAFPEDPTQSADTDGDGIGDSFDLDIDGDGVANDVDVAPYNAEVSYVAIDITAQDLAQHYITLVDGYLSEPSISMINFSGYTYLFDSDGSFTYRGIDGDAIGSWSVSEGAVQIDYSRVGVNMMYVDAYEWFEKGYITEEQKYNFIDNYGTSEIPVNRKTVSMKWHWVESGENEVFWVIPTYEYSMSDSYAWELLGLSPEEVVTEVSEGWVNRLTDYAQLPVVSTVADDWVGTFALPVRGAFPNGDGEFDRLAVDLLTLNSDGTGMSNTGMSVNFTWLMEGETLVMSFEDGNQARFTKHRQFNELFEVYAEVTLGNYVYTQYQVVAEQTASASNAPLVDAFLMSAFTLTDKTSFDGAGNVIPEEVFGFRLETGGMVRNIFSSEADLSYASGVWNPRMWSVNELGHIMLNKYVNDSWDWNQSCDPMMTSCDPYYQRVWVPLSITADTMVVLEWQEFNQNVGSFNNGPADWSEQIVPRVNFYRIYDINIDTDGDGLYDHEDSDIDNDGVSNPSDAFVFDAYESVDSDGDKVGDNKDVFPSDSTEWSDFDMDGIGDNADTDDDNDGIPDAEDDAPYYDTRTISQLGLSDLNFEQCLLNQHGDVSLFDVYEIYCSGYGVTTITGIEVFANLERVNFNEEPVGDYSPVGSLPNLMDFQSTKPGFSDSDLAAAASNTNLRHIWLDAPDLTSIEALRDHPNLNNIHIWGAPLDLEMDVLASLNGLYSLALNAESVDDFATLG